MKNNQQKRLMILFNYVLKNNGVRQMNSAKSILKIAINCGNNTIPYLTIRSINVAFVER